MTTTTGSPIALLYTEDYLTYDLGSQHPLQQRRLKMVFELLQAYGLLAPEGPIACFAPLSATEKEILQVHTSAYVDSVRRAGSAAPPPASALSPFGISPGDTPAFRGMYEAAALLAGGTAEAARLVASGSYPIAFNLGGGVQHHAHPHKASGFGIFNDLAIGIHALLDAGFERIISVDIDVHHGDGTQACFYNDPRVLTISLHESGRFLFPGTGFPEESGGPDAPGSVINLPFFPYTLDDVWHQAFDAVVPAAFARFRPQAVILQLGVDAHWQDPLAHLLLTASGWMQTVEKLLALSEGLPLVVTGGGGYNLKTVARLWTLVAARLAGVSVPDTVPHAFAEQYDITSLQDEAVPDTEEDIKVQTVAYAREMQERLLAAGIEN